MVERYERSARRPQARSTSSTCCCWPATRCATASGPRLLPGALALPDDRRVPGHRPAAGRDRRAVGRREPGRLVVVGDAKQSIYRFRRAEVALFRTWRTARPHEAGFGVLSLTQNFRSRPAILRFVNRVFGELIQASRPGRPAPLRGRSRRLRAVRGRGGDRASCAAVRGEGAELLEAEAAALTALLAEAARGAFEVRDPATGAPATQPGRRRHGAAAGFTQFAPPRGRPRDGGAALRGGRGKSFFDRQEVHEVLAVLRSRGGPGRPGGSLVAALRSSFFGVSDRDIVGYALSGGRLCGARVDESQAGGRRPGPGTRAAGAPARRAHPRQPGGTARSDCTTRRACWRRSPADPAGEAAIANLEKVVALARQAADLDVLTLRGFATLLRTARGVLGRGARSAGDTTGRSRYGPHPHDPPGQGLEAPIVALFDTADDFGGSASVIPLWREGSVAVGFRRGCRPPGWDELEREDAARTWAEARRLLYVACTRARDLLVCRGRPGSAKIGRFWKDLIDRLPRASDADVEVRRRRHAAPADVGDRDA